MFNLEAVKETLAQVPSKSEKEGVVLISNLANELAAEVQRLTDLGTAGGLQVSTRDEQAQVSKSALTSEEKADKVVQLVRELVDDHKEEDSSTGGLMRTFGDEYVKRMTTFANFFKAAKGS